jgi:hypothetical protein
MISGASKSENNFLVIIREDWPGDRRTARQPFSPAKGLLWSPFALQFCVLPAFAQEPFCSLVFQRAIDPSRKRGASAESDADMGTNELDALQDPSRHMGQLELALLRRGVDQRVAGRELCSHCRRSPLIGERVYVFGHGSILCELCRSLGGEAPLNSRLVHGPAFGHTLRVVDQRAA